MPKSRLLILGAGGFGQAVAEIAASLGQWQEIQFVDDCWKDKKRVKTYTIISNIKNMTDLDLSDAQAIVAVGNPILRKRWYAFLEQLQIDIATIIASNTMLSPSAKVGRGSIIMPGCILGASVEVKEGVILNLGVLLDHDVVLEQYAHLGIGAKVTGGKVIDACSNVQAGHVIF